MKVWQYLRNLWIVSAFPHTFASVTSELWMSRSFDIAATEASTTDNDVKIVNSRILCIAIAIELQWPIIACYNEQLKQCHLWQSQIYSAVYVNTNLPLSGCMRITECTAPFQQTAVGCLYLYEVPSNWDDSRAVCQSYGGDMVAPGSTDKFLALKDYMMDTYSLENIWIGVRWIGPGEWLWVNNNQRIDDVSIVISGISGSVGETVARANIGISYNLGDTTPSYEAPVLCQITF